MLPTAERGLRVGREQRAGLGDEAFDPTPAMQRRRRATSRRPLRRARAPRGRSATRRSRPRRRRGTADRRRARREMRVRLDEPRQRGAPGEGVGRPLQRPAHGSAVAAIIAEFAQRCPPRWSNRLVILGRCPVARRCRPDQCGGRRPRRQRRAGDRGLRSGRRRGLRSRGVPRADGHGLPARRSPAEAGVRRRGGGDGRQARGSHRRVRGGDRVPRTGGNTSTTRPPCARGQVLGVYRKQLLPNYSVFDEQRYFTASTEPGPVFEIGGREGRRCRSAKTRGSRARSWRWWRGRRARRQHQRVALLRRPAARARGDARRSSGAGRRADRLRESRRRSGRARVRRRVPRVRRAGRLVARAKQFEEDLLVVDVDLGADAGGSDRAGARAGARDLRGARARHARLRAQERFHRRAHQPLGRHRLVARGRDRGRRARRRSRERRDDAVALLERGKRRRRDRAHRAARRPHVHRADRARAGGVRGDVGARVRRPRARRRRGEPAGAHSRQRGDDDLQQVRLDGAQLRQQERDGHRLRHALRRHGRRLRGDQGRAQDARVRAVPRSQRARRAPT